MQRYLCVRGVPGKLCGHPLQKEDGERRYLGKQRLSRAELDELRKESDGGIGQAEMYRDVEEVVADSPHVRKAIKSGGLEQVGKPKPARSLAMANKLMKPTPPPAPKPSKEEAERKAKAGKTTTKKADAAGGSN